MKEFYAVIPAREDSELRSRAQGPQLAGGDRFLPQGTRACCGGRSRKPTACGFDRHLSTGLRGTRDTFAPPAAANLVAQATVKLIRVANNSASR